MIAGLIDLIVGLLVVIWCVSVIKPISFSRTGMIAASVGIFVSLDICASVVLRLFILAFLVSNTFIVVILKLVTLVGVVWGTIRVVRWINLKRAFFVLAVFMLPMVLFLVIAGFFAFALLKPNYDPNTLPSALIDKPAPEFDLAGLGGGGKLAADSLKGQVVLINFFASWCVPCRLEHPLLMRLAKEEKLPLYGIAYKDNVEDTERLLAQTGDPYRGIGVDRDGRVGLDFGVYGVPETFVIDKSGKIRKRFVGPLTAEAVDKELLPLLKELNRS